MIWPYKLYDMDSVNVQIEIFEEYLDIIRIVENTDQDSISAIKLNHESIRVTNQLDVTLESLSDVIGSISGGNQIVFIYLKHLQAFVTVQGNKINFLKHSLTQECFQHAACYMLLK